MWVGSGDGERGKGGGQHRLLAILSADGVGYSRLMAIDERATVDALEAARAVFRTGIDAERGRVIDTAGDSILAVFLTAAGAVDAAVAIQRALAIDPTTVRGQLLQFRIGIHLGDLIEQSDGTVYGDGVNVAARLQALAAPGGIVVSRSIHAAVLNRTTVAFAELGAQRLKNIAQPVDAFRVEGLALPKPTAVRPGRRSARPRRSLVVIVGALAIVAAASIVVVRAVHRSGDAGANAPAPTRDALIGKAVAVLPFETTGGGPEAEAIATGMTDDLIATLSRVAGLKVSARTSAYFYKGKQVTVAQVARELGVAYLVTGDVRLRGPKIRIAVQLVHAADDSPTWSREYDLATAELIDVQSQVAASIVANLQAKIGQAEMVGTGTRDLEARRLYLQAQRELDANPERADGARALLQAALLRDPQFVRARLLLIDAERDDLSAAFGARDAPAMKALVEQAERLAAAHPSMFEAQTTLAATLLAAWRSSDAAAANRRALELGGQSAQAAQLRVNAAARNGDMSDALEQMRRVVDADPLSPGALGQAAFLMMEAGRYTDALAYADRALDFNPDARYLLALRSTALARLGRIDDARRVANALPGGPLNTYFGVTTLALSGDRTALEARLREIEATERHSFFHAYLLLHVAKPDAALEALDIDQVEPGDFFLRMQYDPAWDPVRQSPRFRQMLDLLRVAEVHDRAQAWRARNRVALPAAAGGTGR